MKEERLYTTGEIAKMAGVTIRTIRYYDDKGILKPSKHNSSGHRLYIEEDFIKLKKILALKYLGLSLEEAKSTENKFEKNDMVDSLKLQKTILKNKISHMKTVLYAIEAAEESIEKDQNLDWNKTIDIIKILEDEKELQQQYLDLTKLDASIRLQDRFSSNEHGWYEWTFKKFKLKNKCKVLEIGCGNGALWLKNIENINDNVKVTLTEVSEDTINDAKRTLGRCSNKFTFQVTDPNNIGFEDGTFDVVIANHILFYMKDLDKVLGEIKRVLKPKGRFYCSTIDSKYMSELEELIQGFNNSIKISEEKLSSKFGLHNGKDILSKYFEGVKKYPYEDKLVINDTKGILEYVYSLPGNIIEIVDNKKKEFEKYISTEINRNKEFYITNNQGLFESIKR